MHWDRVDRDQWIEGNLQTEAENEAYELRAAARSSESQSAGYKGVLSVGALLALGSATMAGAFPAITDQVPQLQTYIGSAAAGIGSVHALAVRLPQKLFENLSAHFKSKNAVIPRELAKTFKDIAQDSVKIYSTGSKGVWYVQSPDRLNPMILSDEEMKKERQRLDSRGVPVLEIMPGKKGLNRSIPARITMTQTLNGKPHGDPAVFVYAVQPDLSLELVSQAGVVEGKIVKTKVSAPAAQEKGLAF